MVRESAGVPGDSGVLWGSPLALEPKWFPGSGGNSISLGVLWKFQEVPGSGGSPVSPGVSGSPGESPLVQESPGSPRESPDPGEVLWSGESPEVPESQEVLLLQAEALRIPGESPLVRGSLSLLSRRGIPGSPRVPGIRSPPGSPLALEPSGFPPDPEGVPSVRESPGSPRIPGGESAWPWSPGSPGAKGERAEPGLLLARPLLHYAKRQAQIAPGLRQSRPGG